MDSPNKKPVHYLYFSAGYALGLMLLMLIWSWCPLSVVMEDNLQKWAFGLNMTVKPPDLPFDKQDVLFLDASNIPQVVSNGGTKLVIADRKVLDTTFRLLAKFIYPGQTVICDLDFTDPSSNDRQLEADMRKIPELYGLSVLDSALNPTKLAVNAGIHGAAGYNSFSDPWLIFTNNFFKFNPVTRAGTKTLPLLLAERYSGTPSSVNNFPLYIGGGLFVNSVMVHPYIDLSAGKDSEITDIGLFNRELSVSNPAAVAELKSKKIILIGNYRDDVHQAVAGKYPGPVLLINIVISLLLQENQLTLAWGIVLFLLCWLLILRKFYHPVFFDYLMELVVRFFIFFGISYNPKKSMLFSYLFCVIVGVVFQKYIEIIPLIIFLNVIEFLKELWFTRHDWWEDLRIAFCLKKRKASRKVSKISKSNIQK